MEIETYEDTIEVPASMNTTDLKCLWDLLYSVIHFIIRTI